ncbi:MAG: hypothetical protein KJI69_04755 [Patescibacteria group bacterium]|nr:hypothetical protein [Patescibacteria group bacterium]
MGTSKGNFGRKMYSNPEYKKKISKANRYKRISVNKKCIRCDISFMLERKVDKKNVIIITKNERKCCSLKCAKSNHNKQHTAKTKRKISRISKKLWLTEDYAKKVLSSKYSRYTSKGEIEVRKHFIEKYTNDEWTYGGTIRYKDIIISRDLYSDKIKICVEYDGIWHFKDIHGQLKDKKNKDRLLKKWCEENKYRLIRISDQIYQENKKEALKKLEKQVYKNKKEYIELY